MGDLALRLSLSPLPTSSRDVTIAAMQDAAPARRELDTTALEALRALTWLLHDSHPDVGEELRRFREIADRSLTLPEPLLGEWLADKTILVTGGTGCIGSLLLGELAQHRPRRLVSVSRGLRVPELARPDTEYLHCDIRDATGLAELFATVQPDIVFHLAAQRDPGAAEREVIETIGTNILGTQNVLAAARHAFVPQLIYASTGKALRPYSPDVYAASKKVGEWLLSKAAEAGGLNCAAVRFTHVVDNSLIVNKIKGWSQGGVVRLHSPGIAFYVQSARESVMLLLNAGLEAALQPRDQLRIHIIRDLDWPIFLVDLTLGVLAECHSAAPIYFCGYEPGYEDVPFPGLYDPRLAGSVSPLANVHEAPEVIHSRVCDQVDVFAVHYVLSQPAERSFATLKSTHEQGCTPVDARWQLDRLSWALLDARLAGVSRIILRRMAQLNARVDNRNEEHRRTAVAVSRCCLE